MKRIITSLTLALLLAILVGCANTQDTEGVTTTEPEEVVVEEADTTEIDISLFQELDASWENEEVYVQEVKTRLENEEETFLTTLERETLEKCWTTQEVLVISALGQTLTTFNTTYLEDFSYYYPLIYRDGESLVLWYTTANGTILLEELYGNWWDSNVVGSLHEPTECEEETLYTCATYHLSYNQESGMVTSWKFGEKFEEFEVPQGATYCGFSDFEGHLFRSGTDVYALRLGTWDEEVTIERIAYNVKYVIDCAYAYASDPWSQPLFLMEDGSIKAYISWRGDEGAAVDDPSHLCELQEEGGY